MTSEGWVETEEGLDKKLSLHYYARMRFISNLLPQLNAAPSSPSTSPEAPEESKSPGLASVVSVLEAGGEGQLIKDDLSLKSNYSLANARTHAITMTSLSMTKLAQSHRMAPSKPNIFVLRCDSCVTYRICQPQHSHLHKTQQLFPLETC
ncbi:hypothetical protein BDW60DRAFT_196751 [Aspergillus nidulans var. acristatus]